MNRISIFFVVLVALLSGCATNAPLQEEATLPKEETKSDLILQLEAYNQTLPILGESRASSRSVAVATADAWGALEGAGTMATLGSIFSVPGTLAGLLGGAVVMGTYRSFKAYHSIGSILDNDSIPYFIPNVINTYADLKDEEVVQSTNLTFALPSVSTESHKTGYLHNRVLETVLNASVPDSTVNYSALSSIEQSFFQTPTFLNALDNTVSLSSEVDQVFTLFTEAVETSVTTWIGLNSLIQNYVNLVHSSSSLTTEEKEHLYVGFTVAAYSYEFWGFLDSEHM